MNRNQFSAKGRFRWLFPARLTFIEHGPALTPLLDVSRLTGNSLEERQLAVRPPRSTTDWENVAYLALWGAGVVAVVLAAVLA